MRRLCTVLHIVISLSAAARTQVMLRSDRHDLTTEAEHEFCCVMGVCVLAVSRVLVRNQMRRLISARTRAFRHLECRRDRALGKQSFSAAQRYRKYLRLVSGLAPTAIPSTRGTPTHRLLFFSQGDTCELPGRTPGKSTPTRYERSLDTRRRNLHLYRFSV